MGKTFQRRDARKPVKAFKGLDQLLQEGLQALQETPQDVSFTQAQPGPENAPESPLGPSLGLPTGGYVPAPVQPSSPTQVDDDSWNDPAPFGVLVQDLGGGKAAHIPLSQDDANAFVQLTLAKAKSEVALVDQERLTAKSIFWGQVVGSVTALTLGVCAIVGIKVGLNASKESP